MWKSLEDANLQQLNDNLPTLQTLFDQAARSSRAAAQSFLNAHTLPFPFLYILMPGIETLELTGLLSDRNREALTLCARKLNRRKLLAQLQRNPSRPARIHQARLWMFQTGWEWQPAENPADYDAVLDAAVALLTQSGENSILSQAVDLLFRRNRQGRGVHDLTWALFQTSSPDVARRIAAYIVSEYPADARLACRLLHLDCPAELMKRQQLYEDILLWLTENQPYLYFTGESFQQTSEPAFLRVDLQAKYLGTRIAPRSGAPLRPLTGEQQESARVFLTLDPAQRETLADYSHTLRSRDPRRWQQWQQMPPAEQTAVARGEKEMV